MIDNEPIKIEEHYKPQQTKKESSFDIMNIFGTIVIIFVLLLICGAVYYMFDMKRAKEVACLEYEMELPKTDGYCKIGDKAIPVIFECSGLFKTTCDIKFIITTAVI